MEKQKRSFFDLFKKKKEAKKFIRAIPLDWYDPIYSQYGSDIYVSDVVQQAINCIVREMKKLQPQHVLKKNNNYSESVYDEIQNVLDNPNELMTTSDFIEKIVWQLFFNYNSFICPVWENGKLTALYPIAPTQVDFLQDVTGEFFIKFTFANGYNSTVKYNDIIHVRYNYSVSEFMGGDKSGQPDNKAIMKSVALNTELLNGVSKALKSSCAINGVVKYNTMMDKDKMDKAISELTQALRNNVDGFLPLDLKGEFIPFDRKIQLVDATTLKFIDEKILRHFGVSLPILTGDYTKAQYESFFQKTLEPLIVSLSQSFTKALFSKRETFGYGHKIIFYHKELDFMTMNEKIQWLTLASNVGAITINEMRGIIGYQPYDDIELGNTPIMSKNFGDAQSVKNMDSVDNKDDSADTKSVE